MDGRTAGEAPRKPHKEIAKVVDVARATPPPRTEELPPAICFNELQIYRHRQGRWLAPRVVQP